MPANARSSRGPEICRPEAGRGCSSVAPLRLLDRTARRSLRGLRVFSPCLWCYPVGTGGIPSPAACAGSAAAWDAVFDPGCRTGGRVRRTRPPADFPPRRRCRALRAGRPQHFCAARIRGPGRPSAPRGMRPAGSSSRRHALTSPLADCSDRADSLGRAGVLRARRGIFRCCGSRFAGKGMRKFKSESGFRIRPLSGEESASWAI